MKKVSNVDEYLAAHESWAVQLTALRKVLLASELEEQVKWGAPCYTLEGKNVVGMAAFKAHCALWFHQGALLDDADGVLVNAQAGKTKALRQWRFTEGDKVPQARVRAYVKAAIALQRSGQIIAPERGKSLVLPDMLAQALNDDDALAGAFSALTPGKQREYAEHIASAKREATQQSRLDKMRPLVLAGKGLNDRYR